MTRLVPIIELLRLIVADPALRQRFHQDPAGLLVEFGIERPEDFQGPRATQCPRMPPVPRTEAGQSIADDYWKPWLAGGAVQMEKPGVIENILGSTPRLPPRSSMTDEQWAHLVDEVKARIRRMTEELRARRQASTGIS